MSEKKPLGFFNADGDFDAKSLVDSIKNAQKEYDEKKENEDTDN